MFQAYANVKKSIAATSPSPPLSHVNIELKFQSEYCSVSGGPLCFLQVTVGAVGDRQISLNRVRPIIDFAEAKDGNAPIGLPLLSFSRADDKSNSPIFSYQLDVCYQDDRKRFLERALHEKAGDCIILSQQGYTFTYCINHPWDYVFTYEQIAKLQVGKKYKLSVGLYSKAEADSFWYRKPQDDKVEQLPLALDPLSNNLVQLVE